MRVANQATLQEFAERIDQADAVVIGGGSGLSSAAGYDHYHWSPALGYFANQQEPQKVVFDVFYRKNPD